MNWVKTLIHTSISTKSPTLKTTVTLVVRNLLSISENCSKRVVKRNMWETVCVLIILETERRGWATIIKKLIIYIPSHLILTGQIVLTITVKSVLSFWNRDLRDQGQDLLSKKPGWMCHKELKRHGRVLFIT